MTEIDPYVLTMRKEFSAQNKVGIVATRAHVNEYSLQASDQSEISLIASSNGDDGCQVVIGVGEDDMADRKSCQESSAGRSVIAMYTTMCEVLCVDASSC